MYKYVYVPRILGRLRITESRVSECREGSLHWKWITSKNPWIENSNSSVQIQIKPKSQFEFKPRDTEESQFLDSVDLSGVASSVEIVIYRFQHAPV